MLSVNIPMQSTTTVAVPMLIKLITAAACDLSFDRLIAMDDALASTKHNPE